MLRRALRASLLLLALLICLLMAPAGSRSLGGGAEAQDGFPALDGASALPRLRALLVAHRGRTVLERRYHGPPLEQAVNVKSVSKSVLSALIGIAIAEGSLQGVDQPIGPFFERDLRGQPDAADKRAITIGDLLTMRSGLERTSGRGYGRWIASSNWVRYVLHRPLLYPPGTQMLYSTGNSHLLSAILTRATGMDTRRYAQRKLGRPLGITFGGWRKDPQGIYLGGNQMRLTPRALLRFGELYRNGGRHGDQQVVPASWVERSLQPHTRSPFSGELYGYSWFLSEVHGHRMFYAWGYGGQFVFVLPSLELTLVTTSDPGRKRGFDHLRGIGDRILEPTVRHFAALAASR